MGKNSEETPRGCSTVSEFFPSYVPESDRSMFESILTSRKKKENKKMGDEDETRYSIMSCKSIERLTSVTHFVVLKLILNPFRVHRVYGR